MVHLDLTKRQHTHIHISTAGNIMKLNTARNEKNQNQDDDCFERGYN